MYPLISGEFSYNMGRKWASLTCVNAAAFLEVSWSSCTQRPAGWRPISHGAWWLGGPISLVIFTFLILICNMCLCEVSKRPLNYLGKVPTLIELFGKYQQQIKENPKN